MWLKCSLCSENCSLISLLPAIFFELPMTRTFFDFPWRFELSGDDCKLKLGTLIGVSGEKLEIIHKKLIVINDPVHWIRRPPMRFVFPCTKPVEMSLSISRWLSRNKEMIKEALFQATKIVLSLQKGFFSYLACGETSSQVTKPLPWGP